MLFILCLQLIYKLLIIRNKISRPKAWNADRAGLLQMWVLSFVSNLKQSALICCLRTRVRKQPIIAPYFEFENKTLV